MSRREITSILQSLFATDEQTAAWTAAARTPETRARIRRWSRIETVGITTTLAGIAMLLASPFASIAVVIWTGVAGVNRADLHWWIWGAAIGVAVSGAVTWASATGRRQEACYADGMESIGTVTGVVVEEPADPEGMPGYRLTISADLPEDGRMSRLTSTSERTAPRVGQTVRFRHNTLDPEDAQDVWLIGFVKGDEIGGRGMS